MSKGLDYGIDLDKLRLEVVPEMLDNMRAIQEALDKIQRILDDVDSRLEDGAL